MNERRSGGLWKTGIVAFLLFVLVVFIIQNITAYDVRFLFWKLSVPGAVLVLVAFLLGVMAALLVSVRRTRAPR